MITKTFSLLFLVLVTACSNAPKPIRVLTLEEQVKAEPQFISGPTQSPSPPFFTERSAQLGLSLKTATQVYAVDFDRDGHSDLAILPEHYSIPDFYRFVPEKGTFVQIPSPFEEVLRASFLLFYDFDNDGIRDCVVGTLNQQTEMTRYPLRLFKGSLRQGRYVLTEVEKAFPTGIEPTASVIPIDFDLDGKLDLFLANWYQKVDGKMEARPDRLLKGTGKGFLDVSNLLAGEHETSRGPVNYPNARPSFGVSLCDIDQNGYPDILVSNSSGFPDKLWLHQRDTTKNTFGFKDVAQASGFDQDNEGSFAPRGGGNSFYAVCADYNNDGFMDIAKGELFHSYDPESRDRSSILTGSGPNSPPQFIRTEYHRDDGSGNWSQGDRRGIWEDLNLDGFVDLLVENSGFPPKSRFVFFEQQPNHAFEDKAPLYGLDLVNPSGTVTLDWNRDAKPDLIIGQSSLRTEAITPRLFMFENTFPTTYQGIRFHFRGKKSNRFAIGARAILKTTDGEQRRMVHESFGNQPSQNAEGLFFGLGRSKLVYLRVIWPVELQSKTGRRQPLTISYDLTKYDLTKTKEITICEDGKSYAGYRKNCP